MDQSAYYERLTRDNAVLLIVDHQVGLYTGVRDIDTLQLTHNIVGLAKAAQALKVPIIVTTTTESMWGPMIPELQEALPGKWVASDSFSLADCSAAPALFYADWVHPIGDAFSNVRAYRKRLNARPSVARTIDEARPYRHFFPLGAPDRD